MHLFGKFIVQIALMAVVIGCSSTTPRQTLPPPLQKPTDNSYYYGLGIASKYRIGGDYLTHGKDMALNDLAGEISVTISGSTVSSMVEKSGWLEDDIRRTILTETRAELDGFELAGTWESHDEYRVLYRLSKDLYRQKRLAKVQSAVTQAEQLHTGAISALQAGDPLTALKNYLRVLSATEKYIPELELMGGTKALLFQSCFEGAVKIIQTVGIFPGVVQPVVRGRRVNLPVNFITRYPATLESPALPQVPVNCRIGEGIGEITPSLVTDGRGLATATLKYVPAEVTHTEVTIQFDYQRLMSDTLGAFALSMLRKEAGAGVTVPLTLAECRIVLGFQEQGIPTLSQLGRKIVRPISESLTKAGYSIVSPNAPAEYKGELIVTVSKGQTADYFTTAFVDVELIFTDNRTKSQIYTKNLRGVKGAGRDELDAIDKAVASAADKLAQESVPELIQTFIR